MSSKLIAKRHVLEVLLFTLLILVSSYLRFKDLGYSEYQDDEHKAMMTVQDEPFTFPFFLSQRKGPMQFLFTRAISVFVPNWRNEVLYRIPFTAINLLSVFIFYLILKRVFKNPIVSFLGALIYSTNGFVVGFSRIVQYQSLNLFFSMLSLYFFVRLYQDQRKPYLFSLLGTISFCLSVFAHWDAIFFVLPVAFYYFNYLFDLIREGGIRKSIKITALNLLVGCLILLPFLIPYSVFHSSDPDSLRYFSRRIGKSTYPLEKHRAIFELYNPYLAIYFIPAIGLFSILKPRKNFVWLLWFGVNFLLIKNFMQKPGTHTYNYVIPAIFMVSGGIEIIATARLKIFRILVLPVLVSALFLMYQTYVLFVHNEPEYPWFDKKILSFGKLELVAPSYDKKEILTFGFPHFRHWKTIAEIVNNDPDECSYITNEGLEIAKIYLDIRHGIEKSEKCYYVIKVKRPFNNIHKDAHLRKSKPNIRLFTYTKGGETLAKVNKVFKLDSVPN